MGTVRIVSVVAALASLTTWAGVVYAQTPSTPDQSQTTPAPTPSQGATNPNAASSPHQRDVTKQPGQESVPNENPNPAAASSPHQQEATRMAEAGRAVEPGMSVQTGSGQSLGTVVDIVPGPAGDAATGYVVIASAGGTATPVPYSSASSMVQNGKLVMDRSRLQKAPKVQQNQLEDHSSATWKKKADSYWGKQSESANPGGTRSEDMQEQQPKDHSMTPDQSGGPSPR